MFLREQGNSTSKSETVGNSSPTGETALFSTIGTQSAKELRGVGSIRDKTGEAGT